MFYSTQLKNDIKHDSTERRHFLKINLMNIKGSFTDKELYIIGDIITNKKHIADGGATREFYLSALKRRRDYLFPLITELSKKSISLKDFDSDLYDEYMIIITLIEHDDNSKRISV